MARAHPSGHPYRLVCLLLDASGRQGGHGGVPQPVGRALECDDAVDMFGRCDDSPSPTAGQGDARDVYAASILGQLLAVLTAPRRRGRAVGFFMLNARDVQPGVGDGVGGVIEGMFFVCELIEDAEFA